MDNNKSCVGGVQYVLHARYHMLVMCTVVLQSGPAPCLWIEFGDGRKDAKEAGRAGSVIIFVILLHTDICLHIIIYNNIVIIFVDIILYHNNMST